MSDCLARKEACQRKRRTNAVPMLGAAGLSLSLASGPAAAIGGVNPDLATSAPIARPVMDEEEIFDVRLATFRVFDTRRTHRRLLDQSIRHRDRSGHGRPARRANTNARNSDAARLGFYFLRLSKEPPATHENQAGRAERVYADHVGGHAHVVPSDQSQQQRRRHRTAQTEDQVDQSPHCRDNSMKPRATFR